MRTLLLTAGVLGIASAPATAQSGPDPVRLRDQVRTWRMEREGTILAELRDWLALPNVASDRVAIRRNADALVRMLTERGVSARLLEFEDSPPAVYGDLRTPGATRTVVFYSHYDGQPVDPERWSAPAWEPELLSRARPLGGTLLPWPAPEGRVDPEARVYARSASDDKSPIIAMLAALDALRASGTPLSVNLKFFFEGEEEAGSDHLRGMLEKHADLLAADLWIFADGPMHQSRRQQLGFGVRGVIGLDLTVYGPTRPLHSGHYGNWAPNPNILLAHLLASMRDTEGRILIAGYYDDVRPLTPDERAAIDGIPAVERALMQDLGLARTEGGRARIPERIALPALNVGGLQGGRAGDGGGANLIGTRSSAYIDFRLVPDQTPARVRQLVEAHVRNQGFHVVDTEPDSAARAAHARIARLDWGDGYPAVRSGMDQPGAQAVIRVTAQMTGAPAILSPTSGGSLPLFHFIEVLGTPFVDVPIVNHDNNQHGHDENLRIQNLWDGIELFAGLMARLGHEWRDII